MFALTMYMLLVAFTPGMNNVISLQNGLSVGLKRSYPFNLGVYVGRVCVNIALIFIGTDIFARFPFIIPVLKVVCIVYLFWLAYQTIRASYNVSEGTSCTSFRTAFWLQFINIKSILSSMTAMIAFVYPYYQGFWALLGFALYISLFAFLGSTAWTIFGNMLKKAFQEHGRIISWVLGILLIYTCYMIVK